MKKQNLLIFLSLMIFAVTGGYLVFISKAAQNPSLLDLVKTLDSTTLPDPYGPVGSESGLSVIIDRDGILATEGTKSQILVKLVYSPDHDELLAVTCAGVYECHRSTYAVPSTSYPGIWGGSIQAHRAGPTICMNIGDGPYNKSTIITAKFKKKMRDPVLATSYYAIYGFAPGTCENNRSANGAVWKLNHGACAIYQVGCNAGTDPGEGSFSGFRSSVDTSLDPVKSSESTLEPNKSPSPSGSIANRQGDADNTTPSVSPQGDQSTEPKVEPSPFFDGKEYEKGSKKDSLGDRAIGQTKDIFMNWRYVGLAVILGAGTGAAAWHFRKR